MFYTFSEPSTVTGLDDFYLLFRGSLKKLIIYIYIEFLNFIGTLAKLNDLCKSTICTTVHVSSETTTCMALVRFVRQIHAEPIDFNHFSILQTE